MLSTQNSMPMPSSDNLEPAPSSDNPRLEFSHQISQPIHNSPECQPITHLSFHIGKDLANCKNYLQIRGFTPLEDDIRKGGGHQFVALGYKKEIDIKNGNNNKNYITNILGVVSKEQMPPQILENGIEYNMVTDAFGNGDINKGSKGLYIYLYYTKENLRNHFPIKNIIFESHKNEKEFKQSLEMIKNSPSHSSANGNFDINCGRGSGSPFNHIIVLR